MDAGDGRDVNKTGTGAWFDAGEAGDGRDKPHVGADIGRVGSQTGGHVADQVEYASRVVDGVCGHCDVYPIAGLGFSVAEEKPRIAAVYDTDSKRTVHLERAGGGNIGSSTDLEHAPLITNVAALDGGNKGV